MNGTTNIVRGLILLLIVAAVTTTVPAEEVEKKLRVSFAVGGHNPQDEIESDVANVFRQANPDQQVQLAWRDPRYDGAAFGSLEVQAGVLGTIAVQYAFSKTFIIEGSIGYEKSDVGNIELSVQPTGQSPVIDEIDFNFSTFHLKAGELTRIPIQLTGLVRFRPRARFNPYLGGGIGYTVHGFSASGDLNELSQNLDNSFGIQTRLTESFNAAQPGNNSTLSNLPGVGATDLAGATVDARDTFAWHLVAGAEMSVRRKMVAFLDLRWIDASRNLEINFNNSTSVGIGVPNFTALVGPAPLFGAMNVTAGGLSDTGFLTRVPNDEAPVGTDCSTPGPLCEITHVGAPGASVSTVSDPCPGGICPVGVDDDWLTDLNGNRYPDISQGDGDGQLDTGFYYVDGGSVAYDAFSLQVGIRFTF